VFILSGAFLVAGTHFSFINLARTGHRVARWVAGYPTRVSPLRSVRRVFNCNQNYQQRTLGKSVSGKDK
jgi:hypothetical protein